METFDVIEVNKWTGEIHFCGVDKSEHTAEKLHDMAVHRRLNSDNFFLVVPHGEYKEGDLVKD